MTTRAVPFSSPMHARGTAVAPRDDLARLPLAAALVALKDAIAHARTGEPEGVHDLRVAARRLDVWLVLGGYRVLRDDLRWLRAAAAPVRDLDVILARGGSPSAQRRREARRVARTAALRDALDHPRVIGLLAALGILPPIPRDDARRRVAPLARAAMRVPDAEDPMEVHRARRAARRLRLALEWLGEPTGPLPQVQAVTGQVADRLALARWSHRAPNVEPALVGQAIRALRDAQPFVRAWSRR